MAASSDDAIEPERRLNQVQLIGTHNSYKQLPDHLMLAAMARFDSANPQAQGRMAQLLYAHAPLDQQLTQGIRLFELDLHRVTSDTAGLTSRYRKAFGRDAIRRAPPLPRLADDSSIRVLHALDHDFRSHCPALSQCLAQFASWSNSNPGHAPIIIILEAKGVGRQVTRLTAQGLREDRRGTEFSGTDWQRVEADIKTVLGPGRIFTPAQLRGSYKTMREALAARGWPRFGDLRGKFIFIASGSHAAKQAVSSLRDPVLFVFHELDHPEAAFVAELDPFSPQIEVMIEAGLIVAAYADHGLVEAGMGQTERRDRLMKAGVQLIMTDFPFESPAFPNYQVVFPEGGYVRRSGGSAGRTDPAE
jgi:hypothetical protein